MAPVAASLRAKLKESSSSECSCTVGAACPTCGATLSRQTRGHQGLACCVRRKGRGELAVSVRVRCEERARGHTADGAKANALLTPQGPPPRLLRAPAANAAAADAPDWPVRARGKVLPAFTRLGEGARRGADGRAAQRSMPVGDAGVEEPARAHWAVKRAGRPRSVSCAAAPTSSACEYHGRWAACQFNSASHMSRGGPHATGAPRGLAVQVARRAHKRAPARQGQTARSARQPHQNFVTSHSHDESDHESE